MLTKFVISIIEHVPHLSAETMGLVSSHSIAYSHNTYIGSHANWTNRKVAPSGHGSIQLGWIVLLFYQRSNPKRYGLM